MVCSKIVGTIYRAAWRVMAVFDISLLFVVSPFDFSLHILFLFLCGCCCCWSWCFFLLRNCLPSTVFRRAAITFQQVNVYLNIKATALNCGSEYSTDIVQKSNWQQNENTFQTCSTFLYFVYKSIFIFAIRIEIWWNKFNLFPVL